jgi:ABC-type phosphate/phosphonate transport system permease subunit
VLPRIISFVVFCYKVLLPLLREAVTNLFEAGWFQNILRGGIEYLRNDPNALNGILTAIGGGGAIFAGILHAYVTYQAA